MISVYGVNGRSHTECLTQPHHYRIRNILVLQSVWYWMTSILPDQPESRHVTLQLIGHSAHLLHCF